MKPSFDDTHTTSIISLASQTGVYSCGARKFQRTHGMQNTTPTDIFPNIIYYTSEERWTQEGLHTTTSPTSSSNRDVKRSKLILTFPVVQIPFCWNPHCFGCRCGSKTRMKSSSHPVRGRCQSHESSTTTTTTTAVSMLNLTT